MLVLICVSDWSIHILTVSGDEAFAVESAKNGFGKWADPSDESYSRETAAEDRRATVLETMCRGCS